jgi:hypothetical protein
MTTRTQACPSGEFLQRITGREGQFVHAIGGVCSGSSALQEIGSSDGGAFTRSCLNGFKGLRQVGDARFTGGVFQCADAAHPLPKVGSSFASADASQVCPAGQVATGYTLTMSRFDDNKIEKMDLKATSILPQPDQAKLVGTLNKRTTVDEDLALQRRVDDKSIRKERAYKDVVEGGPDPESDDKYDKAKATLGAIEDQRAQIRTGGVMGLDADIAETMGVPRLVPLGLAALVLWYMTQRRGA